MNKADSQYLKLLEDILEQGTVKKNRTGTDTISIFGPQMTFDMSEGFPLLTTKRVYWKGVVHELLWFLKGDTNIKYLVDNDVNIWNGDAYREYDTNKTVKGTGKRMTEEEFVHNIKHNDEFAKVAGDLGPVYGKQWVGWQSYFNPTVNGGPLAYNQIQGVIDTLKTNPDDRRMIVSAWNVGEICEMALPPCHMMFQFYTSELTDKEVVDYYYKHIETDTNYKEVDGRFFYETPDIDEFDYAEHSGSDIQGMRWECPKRKLSLKMYQRSCDVGLGLPFNIASYALLLEMVAQCVNMVPDRFIWTGGDTHIYNNHIEPLKEQLTRKPKKLPNLKLNKISDIFDYKFDDIKLEGYNPHPSIKMGLST